MVGTEVPAIFYKYDMRHQTIQQAFTSLHQKIEPTIALTIKPHSDGMIATEESLLSLFRSIYTGVNQWQNGKKFHKKQHLDVPAIVVIEGDKYNRHLHCAFSVEQRRILRFALLFHRDNMKSSLRRHNFTFTSDIKKITDDGWMEYCSKTLKKPSDFDRVHFFGPA